LTLIFIIFLYIYINTVTTTTLQYVSLLSGKLHWFFHFKCPVLQKPKSGVLCLMTVLTESWFRTCWL